MIGFLKSSFQRVKQALSKTRTSLTNKLQSLFSRPWDESTLEQLEQILYEADLGSACAADFVEHVRRFLTKNKEATFDQIKEVISAHALELLQKPPRLAARPELAPHVIFVVGVNGSGKTTSIAKLATHFQKLGKSVLLAAADTFRAAAIEQLEIWAARSGADIVKSSMGSDPAAVVFDALSAAKARGHDIVLVDTAGRLQNKADLMKELEKMRRVCAKVIPDAPHETLLVLDATTGQNALDQGKTFHSSTPLTGLVLTKLDGSAKGGIILPLYAELGIPVQWVGLGEGAEDLIPFDPESYVQGLFNA
jgi:fused signal recognition particle receptor